MEIKARHGPAFKELTAIKPDGSQYNGSASRNMKVVILEHRGETGWMT